MLMKKRIAALGLILSLLFATQAGAEAPIVVNPDSAPGNCGGNRRPGGYRPGGSHGE